MVKDYNVNIDCAMCAQKCEDAIKKIDGVEDCRINFIMQKMTLVASDLDTVIKSVLKTARRIEPDFSIE